MGRVEEVANFHEAVEEQRGGRVVIPLENVIDLLLNLDIYRRGTPVRRGESPGVVELVSVSEQADPEGTHTNISSFFFAFGGLLAGPVYLMYLLYPWASRKPGRSP